MANDIRRFDDLIRTVAHLRRDHDDLRRTALSRIGMVAGGGGGVTDHGALTGLADDDHTQYHTDARGDARYYTKTLSDAAYQPKDTDLTTIAGLAPSNDDVVQRKAGAWTNRTIAQLAADLSASELQPKDADLTTIAGLSPSDGQLLRRVSGAWAAYTLSASDISTGTLASARLPSFIVGRNQRTSVHTTSGTIARTLSTTSSVVSGRIYRVWAQFEMYAASAPATSQCELRFTTDNTEPTTTSTVLARALTDHRVTDVPDFVHIDGLYVPASSHTFRVALCVSRVVGSGNISVSAGATFPAQLVIEDLGPSVSTSGTVY